MADHAAVTLPCEPFGETPDGRHATLCKLQNERIRAHITDYGGRMVRIEVPDRSGRFTNVLLRSDDVGFYLNATEPFGALLGRNANRIARGQITIADTEYQLSKNEEDATLHGGAVGFDKVFWTVIAADDEPSPHLVLRHISADGDQGFPGQVTVKAAYRVENESLFLTFETETTKPTVLSLSAHPYFHLGGAGNGDVLGQEVMITSDRILLTDKMQIPTGEISPVAGTPFDFGQPERLGARIRTCHPQLLYGYGCDQCFVFKNAPEQAVQVAAWARDPHSRRKLEIYTDQPSMQLYSGNKLNGAFAGQGGVIYRQSDGFALEPQGFPDAPHHPNFPSTILRPKELYRRVIQYRFVI